jgi:energy-coupling factor transporter ATP-binding protein EcfA2
MAERAEKKGPAALEVRGLNVYYGASHALQGVNLRLESGVLSVVGRNGMGKTTLCKAILGLVPGRLGVDHLPRPASGGADARRDLPHGDRLRAPGAAALAVADRRRASEDGREEGRRLEHRADLFDLPAARRTQVERRRAAVGGRAADARHLARASVEPAPSRDGRTDRGPRPGDRRAGGGDARPPRRGRRHGRARDRAEHRRRLRRRRPRGDHGERADQPDGARDRAGRRPRPPAAASGRGSPRP